MNENDDDVDWGEPERRARMWDEIGEAWGSMQIRQYVLVPLRTLTAGVRFDVKTFSDGHDTMEFTLLDPATGKVRVTDNFYFLDPTECILVGSEDDLDGGGAMLQGVIKYNAKLIIEVNGQRVKETGPELTVQRGFSDGR